MSAVRKPIEQRRGHLGIAEQPALLLESDVCSDDELLVEQVRGEIDDAATKERENLSRGPKATSSQASICQTPRDIEGWRSVLM